MKEARSRTFDSAIALLYSGQAREALAIGNALLDSGDEESKLSGHLCVGLVFEEGGVDVAPDLDLAIRHFHHVAAMASGAHAFCNLARATMKKGPDSYPAALKFLEIAGDMGHPVELDLGLGQYHETRQGPDAELAKRYFLAAAMKGRFAGFFGYSRVSRAMGQPCRAIAMDISRILLGPWLFLLLGRRTRDEF